MSLKMASVAVSSGSVNVAGNAGYVLVAMDAPIEFVIPPVVWLVSGEFMRLTRGRDHEPQLPRLPPDQWGD